MQHLLSVPALRFVLAILCSLLVLNVSPSSLSYHSVAAYTVQNASPTASLRWANNTITVQLSSSLSQPPGTFKPGSDVRGAVLRALDRWKAVARVEFIVLDTPAVSVNSSFATRDGITLITVADNSTNRSFFPGDNPGLAKLFFDPTTGVINEADVVLNPYVRFSTDGTSFDPNNPHGVQTYDAEEILTHEIGHLLGLGHSGSVGSTMRPLTIYNNAYGAASVAGRSLSIDDVLAIQSVYGARTDGARGTISGVINLASGGTATRAHVIAENIATGQVEGANVTNGEGAYRIEGLAPGRYRLQVENLDQPVLPSDISYAGVSSASPSFRVVETQAGKARRGFGSNGRAKVSAADGGIVVTGGGTAQVNLTVDVAQAASINPIALGAGGAIGSAAVPFLPGQSRTVLVEGAGLNLTVPGANGTVTINSPFVSVVPTSVRYVALTSNNLPYIAFTVSVRADAPIGDYSLRFRTATGETALMTGGISVESSATGMVSNYEPESSLAFIAPPAKLGFKNFANFRAPRAQSESVVVLDHRATTADDLQLHF
ncbi:MAG: matrixin family metalloprotease [Pyrinomonadaceae bacterium MAG19_C2-C3]|nr:matrixin family metalloprotease [Pyrinomonadaceae bacterium MAG19_C2-C3]